MASTIAWLQRQRKSELADLASTAGMSDFEHLRKVDLETALDWHLREHQAKLSKNASFAEFFRRLREGSPVKGDPWKGMSMPDAMPKTPPRRGGRRTAVAAKRETSEPTDTDEAASTALVHAPAHQPFISSTIDIPLPPSPSILAEAIDEQTARLRTSLRTRLHALYASSGIGEGVDTVRDRVSTTAYIGYLATLLELAGLFARLVPVRYLGVLPATGHTAEIPLQAPDLFAMLRPTFWSTLALWLLTSLLLPAAAAYLFNLSLKAPRHARAPPAAPAAQPPPRYDPLTFNVAKGLLAWAVYGEGMSVWGLGRGFEAARARVEGSVPGGHRGTMVASAVGVLTSVYEAILRR